MMAFGTTWCETSGRKFSSTSNTATSCVILPCLFACNKREEAIPFKRFAPDALRKTLLPSALRSEDNIRDVVVLPLVPTTKTTGVGEFLSISAIKEGLRESAICPGQ